MSELPWTEKVAMLSINPDSASSADVAQLASELMNCHQQDRLKTHEINSLVPENRELRKQRDALFDALMEFLDYSEGGCNPNLEDVYREKARAALALVGLRSRTLTCPNCGMQDMQMKVTRETKPDCLRNFIHCNYCGHERPA